MTEFSQLMGDHFEKTADKGAAENKTEEEKE